MTRVVAVLQLRELSSNVSNIELRTLPPGGVKLGKNRQTAAELSSNSNSPVFIRISINIRIFLLRSAKDDDSADWLQFSHRSNELNIGRQRYD